MNEKHRDPQIPQVPDGLPQIDFSDNYTKAAIGNIYLANCNINPRDVAFVEHAGLLDAVQAQAQDSFTLVHSTNSITAQRIAESGYNLGYDDYEASFAYSFVSVVPGSYPNARELNKAALGYRYMRQDTKLVFQFPFPFPEKASKHANRMVVGHTPLNTYEAIESGLIVEAEDGSFYIPPKFLAGTINLDTQETTLPKPEKRFTRLRTLGRKIISNF